MGLRDYLPEATAAPAAPAPTGGGGLRSYVTDEEEPGRLEALLRGVKQGATFGFGDELTGLAESAFTSKTYKQARDEARAADDAAKEAHGGYFAGGELGGGLATAMIPGGIAAKGAMAGWKGAAALGAAYGAGDSTADLTEGDVGGLARDAAIGAGAGAAAHGVIGLAGKAARAVRPALERYATGDESLLASAAKSKGGRAAVGAAVGAYEDDDALEGAVKGAGVALVGPKLLKGASKPIKAAILLALKRGGVAAAEKVAAEQAPEVAERIIKREATAAPLVADRGMWPRPMEEALAGARAAEPAAETALARLPREEAMARVVAAAKGGELTPGLADQAVLSGVPESAVKRLQGVSQRLAIEAPEYTPPGAARALEGEPERLALGPVPESPPAAEWREGRATGKGGEHVEAGYDTDAPPDRGIMDRLAGELDAPTAEPAPAARPKLKLGTRTVAPDELADVQWDGKPLAESGVDLRVMREAKDLNAVRDAKARPVTISVSPGGRQEVVDGRHRILVARERGEPLKVKFVRGAKEMDDVPAAAEAAAGAGPDPRAAAIEDFKSAVAKAKRLEASGDKLRAKTWLAAAEKDFKAAMKDIPAPPAAAAEAETPKVAAAKARVRAARATAADEMTARERRSIIDEVASGDAGAEKAGRASAAERRSILGEIAAADESFTPGGEQPMPKPMGKAKAGKYNAAEEARLLAEARARPSRFAAAKAPAAVALPAPGSGPAELAPFAERVNTAVAAMGDEGRLVGSHKVYIGDVQRALGVGAADKAQFQRAIVDANREGLLTAMMGNLGGLEGPEGDAMRAKNAESLIPGYNFHFLIDHARLKKR